MAFFFCFLICENKKTTTEIAGALFDAASDEMNGSLVIVEAESVEAVRAVFEKDVYWTTNVVRFFSSPFNFSSLAFLFLLTFYIVRVVG